MKAKSLIYGSSAIKYWFPDFPRIPTDLDILSPDPVDSFNNPTDRKLDVCWHPGLEILIAQNQHDVYLDPDLLYTLKVSHLSWDINWWKHLKDAIYLKQQGCKLNSEIQSVLLEIWSEVHSSKQHITLAKTDEEFFTSNVSRIIHHDELHRLISDPPAYTKFKSADTVMFDRLLWDAGDHLDKINCAVEESMVIALERNLVASAGFKHLVTNLSKGYFNLFCIEHALEILNELTSQPNRQKFLNIKQLLKERGNEKYCTRNL